MKISRKAFGGFKTIWQRISEKDIQESEQMLMVDVKKKVLVVGVYETCLYSNLRQTKTHCTSTKD